MTTELWLGLATGFLFGFFLQKGEVLRFEKQVGFLCLKDMTIIKFMLSAILVGMIGLHVLRDMGVIAFSLKGAVLGAQIIGGLLFGIGWAIAGYCPGTAVGSLGEGRIHALWVILGMLVGGAIYAEVFPVMKKIALTWGKIEQQTIGTLLGVNDWVVVGVFALIILGLFVLFERKKI